MIAFESTNVQYTQITEVEHFCLLTLNVENISILIYLPEKFEHMNIIQIHLATPAV